MPKEATLIISKEKSKLLTTLSSKLFVEPVIENKIECIEKNCGLKTLKNGQSVCARIEREKDIVEELTLIIAQEEFNWKGNTSIEKDWRNYRKRPVLFVVQNSLPSKIAGLLVEAESAREKGKLKPRWRIRDYIEKRERLKDMTEILTGLRVNSEFTLGNYLGAILPTVQLSKQENMTIQVFVPDLHSIISLVEGDLYENTLKSIRVWLASGLQDAVFYRQSRVVGHTELAWILNCLATTGELMRMTQFKDKSQGRSVNTGILNYPVLMAADILLYNVDYVVVGEDQFQHLELTRTLARRFNQKYKKIFTLPQATQDTGIRIRDLVNPRQKMSKSNPSEKAKIMLFDDPIQAGKKIMSATTDSFGEIRFDFDNRPGISNLLQIEALLNNRPLESVVKEWEGKTNYGDLKKKVASSVRGFLKEFQKNYAQTSREEAVDRLKIGELQMQGIAQVTVNQVYQLVRLKKEEND